VDTTISKMMKLLGLVFAAGSLANAFLSVEKADWGAVMAFSWAAAIFTFGFTLIWTVSTNKMKAVLKDTPRADVSGGPVATLVAVPAILVAISFVGGAVAAGTHGDFGPATGLLYAGFFCCALINIVWCAAELGYVRRNINSRTR